MRPYRLGSKKVSQAEFDAEVKRLMLLGLKQGEIAERLKRDRTTIFRSMGRIGDLTPAEAQTRQWASLTQDQFFALPEIKTWIESMQARRIGKWRSLANSIHRITDQMQIYPSMFDLSWGKKWLATQTHKSLAQLRDPKGACREWFKFAFHVQDFELTQAGFDAKHYEVGKWAQVRLSDDQIVMIDRFLASVEACDLARWAFNFGIDTCSTADEILGQKLEYYNDMGNLISVQIKRPKLEKTGGSYQVGYVRRLTYDLAKKVLTVPMTEAHLSLMRECLRNAYETVGATSPYFTNHPLHALRHAGAQRYLELTNWNRTAVAKLGHWKAEITLEKHYGDMPTETIEKIFKGANQ